jgi:hypothetical protein
MTGKNFSGQGPFFKRAFSLLFALFLVSGALAFMGCDNDGDDGFVDNHKLNPVLVGTWEDPTYHDGYEIDSETVTQYSADSEYEGESYSGVRTPGTVEFISNFSADSGVIIIKFDEPKSNGRTYGAVYYRELKTEGGTTSAKMSSAGRYESTAPYAEITPVITTLEYAKAEFTLDKGDGHYVTFWGGPYVKQ